MLRCLAYTLLGMLIAIYPVGLLLGLCALYGADLTVALFEPRSAPGLTVLSWLTLVGGVGGLTTLAESAGFYDRDLSWLRSPEPGPGARLYVCAATSAATTGAACAFLVCLLGAGWVSTLCAALPSTLIDPRVQLVVLPFVGAALLAHSLLPSGPEWTERHGLLISLSATTLIALAALVRAATLSQLQVHHL